MRSKINGIPLALIGILTSFALIVITPMVLLHSQNQQDLRAVKNEAAENTRLLRLLFITPSVTVTPTPEVSITPKAKATIVPTKAVQKSETTKPASTSGKVN